MRSKHLVLQQLRNFLLFPIFLSVGLIAFSQNKLITVKVTENKEGTSLPNASVNGTTLGAQIDAKRGFRLEFLHLIKTLTISIIGFISRGGCKQHHNSP